MTATVTNAISTRMTPGDWAQLLLLSLIWGGSFLFIAIAVKELPALLIVLARVGLAALIIIPAHLLIIGKLPRDLKTWIACGGMSIMNNVLPFTAISWGQHHITGGLASVKDVYIKSAG